MEDSANQGNKINQAAPNMLQKRHFYAVLLFNLQATLHTHFASLK